MESSNRLEEVQMDSTVVEKKILPKKRPVSRRRRKAKTAKPKKKVVEQVRQTMEDSSLPVPGSDDAKERAEAENEGIISPDPNWMSWDAATLTLLQNKEALNLPDEDRKMWDSAIGTLNDIRNNSIKKKRTEVQAAPNPEITAAPVADTEHSEEFKRMVYSLAEVSAERDKLQKSLTIEKATAAELQEELVFAVRVLEKLDRERPAANER